MKIKEIKRLGLSSAKENKLIVLKEKEERLQILLSDYDPHWIKSELRDVNEQLTILLEKKRVIEKREQEASERREELNRSLANNKKNQTDIIMQFGLLGKLRKAVRKVNNESALQT